MKYAVLVGLCFMFCCQSPAPDLPMQPKENQPTDQLPAIDLSKAELTDKVLGSIVGSAIGDAMGAPTEMWSRSAIRFEFDYVDSLDDMVRMPSPEGTWVMNLPAGGTTDDTRWKYVMTQFYKLHPDNLYGEVVNQKDFAKYIMTLYENELSALKQIDAYEPKPFENQMMRINWLQEWALVAKPFAEDDLSSYLDAVSRFYGGEQVCAGMLYAPMIGAFYPGQPVHAYQQAYGLSFFDLGYARDITAMTASLVATAFDQEITPEEFINSLNIDPKKYFESRLVGRSAHRVVQQARQIVSMAKAVEEVNPDLVRFPGMDPLYQTQLFTAYHELDKLQQDFPFHPAEIHLINLTALLFTDMEFREALAFVTNYGRDNDTVAAVTGAILGARHGFEAIPEDLKQPVLAISRDQLGIDLQVIADDVVDLILTHSPLTFEE